MGRIVFAITCILSCASCEYEYDYKYISLEKIKEIQITSYGRPDRSAFVVDHDMPMRYELERKTYIAIFEIDENDHWPSIFISSKLIDGSNLLIEEVLIGNCGSFDIGVRYRRNGLSAARYSWSPALHSKCVVDGDQDYPNEQIIGFKIKNQRGEILGEERLPFILVPNGTYYEIDAL